MGRNFPPDYHHHHYSTFPLLSLSLFILSIATTLSIVTALCGFLSRKEEPGAEVAVEKDDNNGEKNEGGETLTSPPSNNSEEEAAAEGGEAEAAAAGQSENQQPLPPPPSMRAASFHYRPSSQASPAAHKKLAGSLSMRVPGLGSRQMSKKDDIFAGSCSGGGERKRDHKKLKHEDSIWKKTIILGEKCRVRDDSEDEVVYDENGNRVTAYHPKPSTTALSMSRQSSAVEEDDQKVRT